MARPDSIDNASCAGAPIVALTSEAVGLIVIMAKPCAALAPLALSLIAFFLVTL